MRWRGKDTSAKTIWRTHLSSMKAPSGSAKPRLTSRRTTECDASAPMTYLTLIFSPLSNVATIDSSSLSDNPNKSIRSFHFDSPFLLFLLQNLLRGVLGYEHGTHRSGPMFSKLHPAILTLPSYIPFLGAFSWQALVGEKHIKKISPCP